MSNYKILLVEDDKIDQLAFKRHIQKEKINYDYKIADSVKKAKKIIQSNYFDIIIVDYMLGDGTGLDILELKLKTPVVMLTGTGSEEIAIKAIKAGALDYVIKDPDRNYLKTLPLTVEHAINFKRTEKQSNNNEKTLKKILENVQTGIVIIDAQDHRIVDVNRNAIQLIGVSKEKIIGSVCHKYICPAEQGNCPISDLGQTIDNSERVLLTANGENVPVLKTVTTVILNGKKHFVESIVDIRQMKDNERDLKRVNSEFNQVFNSSADAMRVADKEFNTLHINQTYSDLFSVCGIETGKKICHNFIKNPSCEEIEASIERVLQGEQKAELELEMEVKDGKQLFCLLTVTPFKNPEGEIIGFVENYKDNTARKKAEKAVLLSEKKYRKIFENIQDVYYRTDVEGNIVEISDSMAKYAGYDPETLIGKNVLDVYYDNHDRVSFIKEMKKTGQVTDFEIRLKDIDGSIIYTSVNAHTIFDHLGKSRGVEGFLRNITERKLAEKEIEKQRNRAQQYLDVAGVMFVVLSANQTVSLINKKGCEILGAKEDEIIGKNWIDNFLPKDKRASVKNVFTKLLSGEIEPVEYYENSVLTKKGEIKTIVWHNSLVRDEQGKVTSILSSGEDITERKAAQEALRISEEKHRFLTENLKDVILSLSLMGKVEYLSPAITEFGGYNPEEEIGNHILKYFSRKSDLIAALGKIKRAPKTKKSSSLEFLFKPKTGEPFWVEVSGKPLIENGKVKKIQCVMRDMSERKRMDDELRESERRFKDVAQSTADWIWEVDEEGKYTYVSKSIKQLLGYEAKDIIGKTPFDLMPEDEAKRIAKKFKQIVSKKKSIVDLENWNVTKSGKKVCLLTNGVPILNEKGKLVGYRGVDKDITERKKTADKLAQTQKIYQEVIENAQGVPYRFHLSNKTYEFFGTGAEALLGIPGESITAEKIETMRKEIIFDNSNGYKNISEYLAAFDSGKIKKIQVDFSILTPAGEEKWISDSSVPINDEKTGEVIGSLGIFQDITDRKKTEMEIQQQVIQAELINVVGQRMSSELKLDALLTEVVNSICNSFDYYGVMLLLLDEKSKRLNLQSIAGGYKDVFPENLSITIGEGMIGLAATTGKTQVSEDVSKNSYYVRKANEVTKSEVSVPIKDRRNKIIGVLDIQSDQFCHFSETQVIALETLCTQIASAIENAKLYKKAQREITERKITEEKLLQNDTLMRATLESTADGILVVDKDGKVSHANKRFIKLWRIPEELLESGDDEELINYVLDQLVDPQTFVSKVQELHNSSDQSFDTLYFKDGRVFERFSSPLIQNEKNEGRVWSFRDVTKQKKAENALKDSESKYRALFENTADPIFIFDKKTNYFLDCNQTTLDRYGYTKEEIKKMTPLDLHPKKDCEIVIKHIQNDTTESYYNHTTKSGKIFQVEISTSTVKYGNRDARLSVVRDISDRKKAEEALRENEQKFRAVVESTTNGICIADPFEKLIYVNHGFANMLGYSVEEMAGMKLSEITSPDEFARKTKN